MPEQTPAPRPGTLSCPQCGAEAAPASVRCAYCGSSLATVACPGVRFLFVGMALPVVRRRRGGRGGRRGGRRQPAPLRRRTAPDPGGRRRVDECAGHCGLWIDTASFERICAEREEQEAVLERGAGRPGRRTRRRPAGHHIPCPSAAS